MVNIIRSTKWNYSNSSEDIMTNEYNSLYVGLHYFPVQLLNLYNTHIRVLYWMLKVL